MRVRTEDKRREIVAVAAQLFGEFGYDRTSMSLISQRLGGSKATLYGYFKSKEELFLATIDYDVTEGADKLMNDLLGARSLREGLIALGRGYLERRMGPRPVSNTRIVANQPEESGIGAIFYNNILKRAWERLANRFEMMMDEGLLRRADPWQATMHWKGLLEGDLVERRFLGAIPAADPKEIEQNAHSATDAFLQIYGAHAAVGEQHTTAAKRRREAVPTRAAAE